jgi:hypothetical protein
MKKTVLMALALIFSVFAFSQEKKVKEVGFSFSNLDNFGLSYKVGCDNKFWRLNVLTISGNISTNENEDYIEGNNQLNAGFRLGREYRKDIKDNFQFIYGADLSFGYTRDNQNTDRIPAEANDIEEISNTYKPGVNLVFGMNYTISNKLVLSAELLPGVNYNITDSQQTVGNEINNTNSSNLSYNITLSNIRFSLSYRF